MKTATCGEPQPKAAPTEYPAQTRPSRMRDRIPVEPDSDRVASRAPSALTGGLPAPGPPGTCSPAPGSSRSPSGVARSAAAGAAPGRPLRGMDPAIGGRCAPSARTAATARSSASARLSMASTSPVAPSRSDAPPRRPFHGAAPRIGRYTRSVTQGHSFSTLRDETRGERHCVHPDHPVAWPPRRGQPVVTTTFRTGSPAANRVSCAASSRLARGSNAEVLPPT